MPRKGEPKVKSDSTVNVQDQAMTAKAVSAKLSTLAGAGKRFTRADFDKPCVDLCKFLLGKILVSHVSAEDGSRVSGRIVETEAYLGGVDQASNTFGGRRTEACEAMYMAPGTVYSYMTYGMYTCVNISSKGDGAAVLIRSLEPLEGLEDMKRLRTKKLKSGAKLLDHQLCNGPSKLTMALNMTKDNSNKIDLTTSKDFYVEHGINVDEADIVCCSRIGLSDRAGAWKNKPLRFYVRNNKNVSVIIDEDNATSPPSQNKKKNKLGKRKRDNSSEEASQTNDSDNNSDNNSASNDSPSSDKDSINNKDSQNNKDSNKDSIDNKKSKISVNPPISTKRLNRADFDKPCVDLSKYLLGKILVSHFSDGTRCSGRIVETEAYLGGTDLASHSTGGKRTNRTEAMYMAPGTAYVYILYGVCTCFNVSSQGEGSAVLIRSLEPLDGIAIMKNHRIKNLKSSAEKFKDSDLCSGPSKLTMALSISKTNGNQVDLTTSNVLYIEDAEDIVDNDIITSSRIGMSDALGEWKDKPLRFYIKGNPNVSVRDRKAEGIVKVSAKGDKKAETSTKRKSKK